MPLSRRTLLRGGMVSALALSGGLPLRASADSARVAPARGGLYTPNAAALARRRSCGCPRAA